MSFSLLILNIFNNIKMKLMKYIIPKNTKSILRVRFSRTPIFDKRYNKIGMKNRNNVQVISKLIRSLPNLLMFLIFPFLDVHRMNGIKIPRRGKNRKVRAERLRNVKYLLSSFMDQSINSSGFKFNAFDSRLSDSPVGFVSPFSIL